MAIKYKRVLIKVSGEALAGDDRFGVNDAELGKVAAQIKEIRDAGVEVAVVVGGGNFFRGRTGGNIDKPTADYMGMLATCMNGLALQSAFEAVGIPARVQTAIEMRQLAEPYIRLKAGSHLNKGRVVIFACGTGNPFFSTDTAAALRAAEIGAEVILLAKKVDGVYDSDPKLNPDAKKYDTLSHIEVLQQGLHVMDSTAASLCMDNNIEILVFNLDKPDNIVAAMVGETIGTTVK